MSISQKYTGTEPFDIEGRRYKLTRLSFDDFHTTGDLIEQIFTQGSPAASLIARMFDLKASPEELAPYADQNEAYLERAADHISESKARVLMSVLSPLLGIPKARLQFNEWIADHLVCLVNPNDKMSGVKIKVSDLKDSSIFPLDSFITIVDKVWNHPDLRSFFDKIQNHPKILLLKSSTPPTLTPSNGEVAGAPTTSSGVTPLISSGAATS